MEQLCVMVYETADSIKKMLHDVLVAYAVRMDFEVVIRWLKTPLTDEGVCNACADAQLAFVNADEADKATQVGNCLYRTNPECKPVFYGNTVPQEAADIVRYFSDLMPSRPIRYLYRPSLQSFSDVLSDFSAAAAEQKCFRWENRSMKYRIPYGCIRYFRSDRNNVYLNLVNGNEYAFPAKLSAIAENLPKELFVRVHQSYLVNRKEILTVDKAKKAVLLRNGEQLYVSKARYQETVEACG